MSVKNKNKWIACGVSLIFHLMPIGIIVLLSEYTKRKEWITEVIAEEEPAELDSLVELESWVDDLTALVNSGLTNISSSSKLTEIQSDGLTSDISIESEYVEGSRDSQDSLRNKNAQTLAFAGDSSRKQIEDSTMELIEKVQESLPQELLAELQNAQPDTAAPVITTEQVQQSVRAFNDSAAIRMMKRMEDYDFYRANYRTIYNFIKVYPYAMKVKGIVEDVNRQLESIHSDKERKAYIKIKEKELFDEFEQVIRKMSYSQGKILLKLIYRETGQSTYDIIKTYKGAFTATFWYGVGRLFTANLKAKYDKEGEDQVIEDVYNRWNNGDYKVMENGAVIPAQK